MANDQINQYLVTATAIDDNAYWDIDNFVGGVYQTQKVPNSLIVSTFVKNIINSDLTQTANRVQNFDGNTQSFINNRQFKVTSYLAPVTGANIELSGFGQTATDEIVDITNELDDSIITFYGDKSLRFRGDIITPLGNTGFTGTGSYSAFVIEKGIVTGATAGTPLQKYSEVLTYTANTSLVVTHGISGLTTGQEITYSFVDASGNAIEPDDITNFTTTTVAVTFATSGDVRTTIIG